MAKSLSNELKRIGIDEELAAEVGASLDPDYNANKKDVLMMQEAIMKVQETIMQVQMRTDNCYHELNNKIEAVKSEMHSEFASIRTEMAGIRTEMASMNRQYLITFGGLITTIVAVFLVNFYFHL